MAMSELRQEGQLIDDHEYDGIQELDNSLPRWWLYGFYFTIAFGVAYFLYYHLMGMGVGMEGEFLREMADAGYRVPKAAVEGADDSQGLLLFVLGFLCALLMLVVESIGRAEKEWQRQLEEGTYALPSAAEQQKEIARQIEEKLITGHEYDGIQELDNDLPRWWLIGFYFTIAFAVAYLIYYHLIGTGVGMEQEFLREMAEAGYQVSP
jgi:hypothetical protein